MTQEDKELLLKNLCAMLPYEVKCDCKHAHAIILTRIDIEDLTVYYADCDEWEGIEDCKPYLRSMSTMTEEEFKEYHSMLIDVDNSGLMNQRLITKIVDWLDEKMFDHRNLVPKGLALEAPEGMYKTE